jgi:AcrR family transcriptional regulator
MATLVSAPPDRDTTAPDRILRAATALFAERGYHGTSMRTLARGLRVETPSLYYHFPSKQEILFAILDRTLDDLLDGLRQAVAAADGAEDGLRSAVRFHVLFHARRRLEAFVSHSELRSLTPAHLRRVVAKRDQYEQVFRGLLAAGVRSGVFRVADVKLAAMAILGMCTGVATWFADGGRLAPEAIAGRYVDMIGRSVGRRGKGPRA